MTSALDFGSSGPGSEWLGSLRYLDGQVTYLLSVSLYQVYRWVLSTKFWIAGDNPAYG